MHMWNSRKVGWGAGVAFVLIIGGFSLVELGTRLYCTAKDHEDDGSGVCKRCGQTIAQ